MTVYESFIYSGKNWDGDDLTISDECGHINIWQWCSESEHGHSIRLSVGQMYRLICALKKNLSFQIDIQDNIELSTYKEKSHTTYVTVYYHDLVQDHNDGCIELDAKSIPEIVDAFYNYMLRSKMMR